MRFRPMLLLMAVVAAMPSSPLLTAAPPTFSFSAPQLINIPDEFGYDNVIGIGDVNGDGNTDLLTRAGLLWGDGQGNFTPSRVDVSELFDLSAYPANDFQSYPFPLVDLNGDGHLDFIQYVHGTYDVDHCDFNGNDSINIFLGDGKGHFTFKTTYTNVRTNAAWGVIGDFNRDGKPDLAVVGGSDDGCQPNPGGPVLVSNVLVLTNQGGGTFSEFSFDEGGTNFTNFGTEILTGDFNGDGKPDLAIVAAKEDLSLKLHGESLQVLDGNGDGTFALGTPYSFDSTAGGVLPADLNGDKRTDLIAFLSAKNAPGALPRTAILLAKQTTGFYWDKAILHNKDWGLIDTSSLNALAFHSSAGSLVDLNHDGKPDLPLFHFGITSGPSYLEILGGEGGATFGPAQAFPTIGYTDGVWAIRLVKGGPVDMLVHRFYPATSIPRCQSCSIRAKGRRRNRSATGNCLPRRGRYRRSGQEAQPWICSEKLTAQDRVRRGRSRVSSSADRN